MFDANEIPQDGLRSGAGGAFGSTSGGKQKVRFLRGCTIDAAASAVGGVYTDMGHPRQGEFKVPVYRDAVMIAFTDPDPPHDETIREATKEDFAQYAAQWAHAQKVMDLTPVHYLPGMTPAKHEMCKAQGIFWVEQIAQRENLCPELKPFALTAQQYLLIAQGGKPRVKLAAA